MRIVFMGSPSFAIPSLEMCTASHDVVGVFCQPDRKAGRGKKLRPPAVKERALQLELPVFQPRSMRHQEALEEVQKLAADIAVVVAYGKILPKDILEVFPKGCINVHGSLLPAYRGAAPIQWAIIDGCDVTGVSIMQLDEGMDTGPVFAKKEVPIGEKTTSGELFERLAPIGAKLLGQVLQEVEGGTAQATAQDESQASHARMLSKTDGHIDWSKDAKTVSALIRGVDPWPSAQTDFRGKPIRAFGAWTVSGGEGDGGTVLAVDDDGIVVACGEGAVKIAELQAAGKKRLPAAVFARGAQMKPGERFGD